MVILHIEHPITDLDTWRQAFTRFAPAREQAGVLETHVYQPVDDDHYIVEPPVRIGFCRRELQSVSHPERVVVAAGLAWSGGHTRRPGPQRGDR
jgi:hypothetical protein